MTLTTTPDTSPFDRLFEGYTPPESVFDEMLDETRTPRPHWRNVAEQLQAVSVDELNRRDAHADQLIAENGITYSAWTTAGDSSRPWELDVVPAVYAADDWQNLEAALVQRARLLNMILEDIYGPQKLLTDGLLPAEIVLANPQFQRALHGQPLPLGGHLQSYSAELARSPNGRWWVMADRASSVTGWGYALENRIVASRTWPHLIQECHVQRLAPFFMALQQNLHSIAPRHRDNPRIVILSPGPADPYYFEDAFLSRYLGYTLVEGGDLAVRDDQVWLKTLGGLFPVDVILNRAGDAGLDPLELSGVAPMGVPGLLQAVRNGNVVVANPLGAGLVESPVFMAFLPGLCRKLLGEELATPSIATWWCRDKRARDHVLKNLSSLVLKPALARNGDEEIIGSELAQGELEALKAAILAKPHAYVAQEQVTRSTAPMWQEGTMLPAHVAMRTFLTASEVGFQTLPGGLIRYAKSSGPLELSVSAGDGSKDAWVLSDGPVAHRSLLGAPEETVKLQRGSVALPSRVADNLFWLGRQLERADGSARLLRTAVDRMAVESQTEMSGDLSALIRVLAGRGLIEPGMALKEMRSSLPAAERMLLNCIFEDDDSTSIRTTLAEVWRLASIVRDRISLDTWRVIHRMYRRFLAETKGEDHDLGDALPLLDRLVFEVAACYGLATDTMTRSQAWRFMDIGRRLERGMQTVSLLQHSCTQFQRDDLSVLQSLLDVCDSSMTYRSRYLARTTGAPVLDLLLTDETNPRSVAFQLAILEEHIQELPREQNPAIRGEDLRTVMSALHRVRMADVTALCHWKEDQEKPSKTKSRRANPNPLETLLSRLDKELVTLSQLISRRYLIHAGPLRQFPNLPWETA